ncbi:hypothetical protein PM082_016088 [Marasmius tenuissimus]|nr:hypothetical protein PM082_016088 [Marasmius tenuissimus]
MGIVKVKTGAKPQNGAEANGTDKVTWPTLQRVSHMIVMPWQCLTPCDSVTSRVILAIFSPRAPGPFNSVIMVHVRLNETESNPNPHINFISALPASTPEDQEDARQFLRALAAQVRPVMKAHGFVVNSLEEVGD